MSLLLKSLVLSHLSYCVTVWGPSLRSILLQQLQRMQNCAVRLCCNLQKYDHVLAFYHKLNWLPLPCFIQFKSLCLMYHQYHHFKCIPLEPPIIFGETSLYCTRTPVYFATIPMFAWVFHNDFFISKPHNSGIHCHFLWLIILTIHFMSMWMPLDGTVTHYIDYYDCSYLFILLLYFVVLLYCFVVCSFVVVVWLLGVCFVML